MGSFRGVILVGYRASGKSTLLRLIARLWRWPTVDIDAEIERTSGQSVAALFASEGESGFRDREAAVLASVLKRPAPIAVATGGGCIERADNRRLLIEAPHLVCYLEASVDFLAARLAADTGGRPSLSGAPVHEEVDAMLARRSAWYQAVADAVLDPRAEAPGMLARLGVLLSNPPSA